MLYRNVLLAALAATGLACEPVSAVPDGGGPDGPPNDPPADAGGPFATAPIEGYWQFILGDGVPSLRCDVAITPGAWLVNCPETGLPEPVGDGCERIYGELHLSGSLTDAFDGVIETESEYAGPGCAALSYQTGIRVVAANVVMAGTHDVIDDHGGFWSAVGGVWGVVLAAPDDPTSQLACSVIFGAGGVWTIECPTNEVIEVVPYCIRVASIGIEGTIDATAMVGEAFLIHRHTGMGCGSTEPPEIRVESIAMSATKL